MRFMVLTAACVIGLCQYAAAQEPPAAGRTEIELSATAQKIAVASPPADVTDLIADQVQREYSETLRKDLEGMQGLALLRDGLPSRTSADSFPEWLNIGCQWLIVSKVSQTTRDGVAVEAVVYDVGSGKRVASSSQAGNTSNYRRLAHMVADAVEEFLTGTPGVSNSRVIFCKEESPGVKEIFQADRDGSNMVKLTNHRTLTMSPTVSRDGRLAYLSYLPTPTIWGQKVAGGPCVRLYPPTENSGVNVYTPVRSPDGGRIAFVQTDGKGDADIMLLTVDTGMVRRLTSLNGINSEMCWNPAGNQIAFTSDRDGTVQIYIMEDDGTNVRKLGMGGQYNSSPAWSPDGSMIAFVSRFEDNFDLFVYRLGEPYPFQITTGFDNSENPAWSPDSRQIMFSSTRAGRNRLYATDLSGNRVERVLAQTQTGCQQPVWVRGR